MLSVLTLVCVCRCSYAQTARVTESLPDGSYIVEINGTAYRAITSEKTTELAKQKIDLTACQQTVASQRSTVADLNQQVALKDSQIELWKAKYGEASANFRSAMGMYETEKQLRVELRSQFIPHSNVGGFGGWLLKAVDSPWSQAFWKIAIPTAQTIKIYRSQ